MHELIKKKKSSFDKEDFMALWAKLPLKLKIGRNNKTKQDIQREVKHQNKTKHFNRYGQTRIITFWTQ
jgi:hypothetical protein